MEHPLSVRVTALSAGLALLLGAGLASAQPRPAPPPSAPLAAPPVFPLPPWIVPPPTLPYDDGEPIPAGYSLQTRLHRPLIVAGSVTFGTSYLISIIGAAAAAGGSEGASFSPLFVPCVGPFIALGTADTDALGQFWLTLDGLTQSAGAAMLVAGILIDQKYLQRNSTKPTALFRPELSIGPASTRFTWRF